MRRARGQSSTAFLILGAAYVAAFLAPLCSAALRRSDDLAWIDPAALRYFSISDSAPRNLLYRLGVLAAGLLLLLLDGYTKRWRRWISAQNPDEADAGFLAAVAAWTFALFFAGGLAEPLQGLAFFLGLLLAVQLLARRKAKALPAASKGLFAALACVAAAAALAFAWREAPHFLICGLLLLLPSVEKRLGLRKVSPRRFAAPFVLGVLFCAFWATIPPAAFRFPLDLSRLPPNLVTFYELHLDVFALAPALRLGAQFDLSAARQLYGLASPVLMVVLNRAAGWPIDIGTFLKISFALKYLFVCCAVLMLYLYNGRRFLPAMLFSLWVLSWNNFVNPSLEANHSAVRFIGVPIFFLMLWGVRRRSFPFLLAFAAPALWLCTLINPETALALLAAALTYAWYRWREDGWAARLGRTLALVVAVSPAALFYRGEAMSWFSAGFGGADFVATPAPFAVILLSLIVWADVAASADARSPKNAFRGAAAAFLLIWGTYYVNRPMHANLNLYLFVFSFFALDIVRAAAFRNASFPRRAGLLMLIAVAAPLLTGALTDTSRDFLWALRQPRPIFHPAPPDRIVAGVHVSEDLASRLRSATEAWKKYARPDEPCMILTSHPILLSVTTCVSSLPVADPLQAFTLENNRRALKAILSSRANFLFIEPDRDLADADRRDAFVRMRAALSPHFRLREDTPHLEVWERR